MDVPAQDLREAIELQRSAGEAFLQLPSKIRDRFKNDPIEFLAFLDDPKNHQESVELGLRMALKTSQDQPGDKKTVSAGGDPPKP